MPEAKRRIPNHDIVVVGASAGGVETLVQLVKLLPSDLPAAVFVTVHFPSHSTSALPQILTRLKTLPIDPTKSGTTIAPGRIYVAPPDHHLLLQRDRIHLSHGPRENGHRPAIDTLFRSAAHAYRQRVIGVVLSGALDDGTAGLFIIKAHGGIAIVQDPEEALFNSMPKSAIAAVEVDAVLTVADIAERLIELVHVPIKEIVPMSNEIENESELAIEHESEHVADEKSAIERGERSGLASAFTCPDCGGVLWELQGGNLLRYRCHVGHAYSINSLLAEKADDLERALWTAQRSLAEKAALARRMAARAHEQRYYVSETQFLERAEEAEHHADVLRKLLMQQIDMKLMNDEKA